MVSYILLLGVQLTIHRNDHLKMARSCLTSRCEGKHAALLIESLKAKNAVRKCVFLLKDASNMVGRSFYIHCHRA